MEPKYSVEELEVLLEGLEYVKVRDKAYYCNIEKRGEKVWLKNVVAPPCTGSTFKNWVIALLEENLITITLENSHPYSVFSLTKMQIRDKKLEVKRYTDALKELSTEGQLLKVLKGPPQTSGSNQTLYRHTGSGYYPVPSLTGSN